MIGRFVATTGGRSVLTASRNSTAALSRGPTSIRAISAPARGAGGPTARAAARALSAQPRPYEGPYYFTPGGAFPLDDDRNPPRGPGGGHPAAIALPEERPSTEDAMLFPDPVAALEAAAALRADQATRRLRANDDEVAKAA